MPAKKINNYIPAPGYSSNPSTNRVKKFRELKKHKMATVEEMETEDTRLQVEQHNYVRWPKRFQAWVETWPTPVPDPEQEDMDWAADLMAELAMDMDEKSDRDGDNGANNGNDEDDYAFSVPPFLHRFERGLLAGIGAIARGVPLEDVPKHAGLTRLRMKMICHSSHCADMLGPLWKKAWATRKEVMAERHIETLNKRALDGSAKPVVVRRGKDNDEIVMIEQPDNKLLEVAIAMDNPKDQKSGNISVGQAVIFNVESAPPNFKELCGITKQIGADNNT